MALTYQCHLCRKSFTIWSDEQILEFAGSVISWDEEGSEIQIPDPSRSQYPQNLKAMCPNCKGVYVVNLETLTAY